MSSLMRFVSAIIVFAFLFGTAAAWAFDQHKDDLIYNDVIRKLANDPDVKGGTFEVDVKEGVVSVKGVVETEKLKEKAERIIKRVKGVKSVVNQIVVKPRIN